MSDNAQMQYRLPSTLVARVDISRIVRELEFIDGDLAAQKIRSEQTGEPMHMPNTSQNLTDFVTVNQLDLQNDQIRRDTKKALQNIKDHAPVVHLTFASDADAESIQKIVDWLRANAHPYSLVTVGLQPSLIGGVYIRTPNHVHDLSIRAMIKGKRDVVVRELEALV